MRTAPAAEPAVAEALRDRLTAAGYEHRAVERLQSSGGLLDREAGAAALALRAQEGEPLTALVGLFIVGCTLPEPVAAAALAPIPLDELERAGLLAQDDEGVRALVQLDEIDGLVLAADPERPRVPDHVVRVGPATRTVASLTVRAPAKSALDVGTGSGAQALLAARHCERVLGVDVNERALRFAELNAAANLIEGVEWRAGDFFEPAGAETFDLIVANPPYVISPGLELTFRDGPGRDEVSRAVVQGTAARLRPGGFATMLCSWICDPGAPFADAPRRWLEGSGCDAWLLHIRTDDAIDYAANWSDGETTRWLEHYRHTGIEAIGTGALVLRRREGRSFFRADELRGLRDSASAQILAAFDAGALLAERGPEALLDERLAPAEGARLLRRADFREGGFRPERVRLVPGSGVRVALTLPDEAGAVIERLDGTVRLRDVAGAAECLPALAELAAVGLLVLPV